MQSAKPKQTTFGTRTPYLPILVSFACESSLGFICSGGALSEDLLRAATMPPRICGGITNEIWRLLLMLIEGAWRARLASSSLRNHFNTKLLGLNLSREIPILISITWDKVCECCEKISWEYPWTCIEVSVCILVLRRGNKEFKQISDTQYTFVILLCCGSEQFYFSIE